MKTLQLVRHAKSDWSIPGQNDRERGLSERGEKACRTMASFLQQEGVSLENIFCSPARRAQLTIEGIDAALEGGLHWQVDENLYTFSASELVRWLRQLPDEFENVTIAGHNPAFTDLVNELSSDYIDNMPTCSYVRLDLDISCWKDLKAGKAQLVLFITPKKGLVDI